MARSLPSWNHDDGTFAPRAAIVILLVLLTLLLIWLRQVVLIIFAAVVVAVALQAAAIAFGRFARLGPRISLALVSILTVVVIAGSVWLLWPSFQSQIPGLFERIQAALGQLEQNLGIDFPSTAEEMADTLPAAGAETFSFLLTAAGAIAAGFSTFLLVLVAGIFIAAEPSRYRHGVILMFPIGWHGRIRKGLQKAGEGLLLWLRAQGIAMVVVGSLTGLAAWVIGLPGALALGVIAGLGDFIPIVGPFVALLPAALVAFGEGTSQLIATIVAYIVIQQLEANLLVPLLQRRIVELPPVLLLFSMIAFGFIFGIIGVIVAAPLTITIYILIREFYVRDLLGQATLMDAVEAVQAGTPLPEAIAATKPEEGSVG